MSSSDKIVYAPRAESGHANSRKVRSTWPKVIATESYLAVRILGLRPRATNLTLAVHSPAFVSLRVSYYYIIEARNEYVLLCRLRSNEAHPKSVGFGILELGM